MQRNIMPKRKLNETRRKEEGLTRKEEIIEFWERNCQYNGLNLQKLEMNDVFSLYLKSYPRTRVNFQEFKRDTPTLGVQEILKITVLSGYIPFSVEAT